MSGSTHKGFDRAFWDPMGGLPQTYNPKLDALFNDNVVDSPLSGDEDEGSNKLSTATNSTPNQSLLSRIESPLLNRRPLGQVLTPPVVGHRRRTVSSGDARPSSADGEKSEEVRALMRGKKSLSSADRNRLKYFKSLNILPSPKDLSRTPSHSRGIGSGGAPKDLPKRALARKSSLPINIPKRAHVFRDHSDDEVEPSSLENTAEFGDLEGVFQIDLEE